MLWVVNRFTGADRVSRAGFTDLMAGQQQAGWKGLDDHFSTGCNPKGLPAVAAVPIVIVVTCKGARTLAQPKRHPCH